MQCQEPAVFPKEKLTRTAAKIKLGANAVCTTAVKGKEIPQIYNLRESIITLRIKFKRAKFNP